MISLPIRRKDADIDPAPCTRRSLRIRSREMVVDPMIPGEEHTSPRRTSQTSEVLKDEDRTHDPLASDPVAIRAPRKAPRVPPKVQSYAKRPVRLDVPSLGLVSESNSLKPVTPSNYVCRTASRNKSSRNLSSRTPYPLRSTPQNRQTTSSVNQSTLICCLTAENVSKVPGNEEFFLCLLQEDEDAEAPSMFQMLRESTSLDPKERERIWREYISEKWEEAEARKREDRIARWSAGVVPSSDPP